ncbi:MAG: zf-TFIIB domain-containing protein [Ignavibacteriaceae bacterium]
MICPVSNEPMIVLELNEIEIDYCPDCKGIWLDGGELELLIEDENERKRILSSFQIESNYLFGEKLTNNQNGENK